MSSSYTFNTNSPRSSSIAYSEISRFEKSQEQYRTLQNMLDTLALGTGEEKKAKKESDVSGNRVVLPAPATPKRPDALTILAEAFSSAFTAMSQGTSSQAKDFTNLQQLNQTMSQSVLSMTQINIEKEQKAMKTAAEIQKFQEERAAQLKTMSDVLFWVGIGIMVVVMVVTVASSIFDLGASDAALPEEIEMTEMLAEGGEAGGEGGADAAATAASEATTNAATSVTEETASAATETATEEASTESVASTEAEATESGSNVKNILFRALKFAFGATMASPMLITGITQLQLRDKLLNLKTAQEELGTAMAQLEKTNGTYQFYQQLLNQQSAVINEEGKDATEVVQTFADITHAYKQITYGLAQAV